MYVLVACEESQVVCKAFRDSGHIAFSCDLQECSGCLPGYHIVGDVRDLLFDKILFRTQDNQLHYVEHWDLIIAHPPCTMISKVSSAAYHSGVHSIDDINFARDFFMLFYNLPERLGCRVCIENPVPMSMVGLPAFSQTIQPYEFGDNWTKLTCLWLKGLPPLVPNCYALPGSKRSCAPSWVYHHFGSKKRSKTFPGIARAMAQQWNFD